MAASSSTSASMHGSIYGHASVSFFPANILNGSSNPSMILASTATSAIHSSSPYSTVVGANTTLAAHLSGTMVSSASVVPTAHMILNATHSAAIETQNSTSRASMYLPCPSGNASLHPHNVNASHWEACQASYVAWSNAFEPELTTSVVTRIESNHSLTFHATYGHANVHTTVNGYPRAHGTLTPTSVTQYITRYLQTSIETQTYTSTRNATLTSPRPTCAIATAQCSSMWQSYLNSLGLPTNVANATEPMITPMPTNRPRCALDNTQATCSSPSSADGQCQIEAVLGRLFYWPSFVVDAKGNTTGTQYYNTSEPMTALFGTVKMTYPSVYLFLYEVSARTPTASSKHCITSAPLGALPKVVENSSASKKPRAFTLGWTLLELQTTALSSLVRDLGPGVNTASAVSAIAHGGRDYEQWMQRIASNTVLWNNSTTASYRVEPVNYRGLGAPPAEAYYLRPDGAPGCNLRGPHPECSTIFNGAYVPQLAVPTQVRAFHPSFADCAIALLGSFEPPEPISSGYQYGPSYVRHPEAVHTSVSTVDTPCTSTCRGCCMPGGDIGPSAPQILSSLPPATNPSFSNSCGSETQLQTHDNAPTNIPAPVTTGDSSPLLDDDPAIATDQTLESSPAAIIMSFLSFGAAEGDMNNGAGVATTTIASPAVTTGQAAPALISHPNAVSILSAALQTEAVGHSADQTEQAGSGSDGGIVGSTPEAVFKPGASSGSALKSPDEVPVTGTAMSIVKAVQTALNQGAQVSQASIAVVTIARTAYTASASENKNFAVIGAATLTVGGQAQLLDGQTISAASGGVIVNGQTVSYSAPRTLAPTTQGALVTIGGQTFTAVQVGSPSTVRLGDSILSVGGPPATISGQVVSLGAAGLVLLGGGKSLSTTPLSPASTTLARAIPVTLGSQTLTAAELGSGTFVLGSVTFSAGGAAATISGQIFSAASSGLLVNGQTLTVEAAGSSQSGVVLSASSRVVTAAEVEPGVFAIGTALVTAGGPAIAAAGESFSAIPSGLIVNGRTSALSVTAIEISPGVFAIGSKTISAGGPAATISDLKASAVDSGIVVEGQTIAASAPPRTSPAVSGVRFPASLNLPTATEISRGVFSIGLTTLSADGPAMTVLGHIVSVGASGLVVDGTSYKASSLPALSTGVVFTEETSLATATEIAPGIFAVGTAILKAGGPAMSISGRTISAGPSGLLVDGTSCTASGLPPAPTGVVFTQGSILATATEMAPGIFVFGTATLSVGGPAAMISGQTLSAADKGLVINGQSLTASTLVPRPTFGVLLTESFKQTTATEIGPGVFAIGTVTLTAGDLVATIAGETISAVADGLVVDGQTVSASLLQGLTSKATAVTTQVSLSAAAAAGGPTQAVASGTQKAKKSFAVRLGGSRLWVMACLALVAILLG
ncbi:hypothetical protein LTR78_003677 [Recurvomyces mirabilis]|uniref:Uncharacterized protein n=1 Tax=Recurvomyces mirabilis TaxID=574656 RepID=A0AAE0WR03_9PEZI|nr:hypothetical protein LTR78_003677 [Recurvomyces mirabilis]KAK5154789.1 hypothetical protein LTS14_006370 [Recurvomyces mirabilis]